MARRRGFALAGVAVVTPPGREDALRGWVESGKHGDMAFMADQLAERCDPRAVLAGARSVLMVGDLYASRDEWHADPDADPDVDITAEGVDRGGHAGRLDHVGRIGRYARGRDYHHVIKRRLHGLADELRERFPGERFRTFTDSAPVLERDHAIAAGLGWIGKHTLVIHPKLGSWMVLGGFFTTLELEAPATQAIHADACGTCTRCIDACPTDAITPYSVDATRCISYLTIERRGAIDERYWRGMGDWIAGCDVCQEVCPHNSRRATGVAAHDAYAPRRIGFDLLDVLRWDEATRRARLTGSSLKRITLTMMKRNALIAAGNALERGDDDGLLAAVRDLAWSAREDELVRTTARRVLARLGTE